MMIRLGEGLMTPDSFIQVSLVLIYLVVVISCIPAFCRLVRGTSKVFDGIKSSVALLGAALINLSFIKDTEVGYALAYNADAERVVSAVLIALAFLTLLFVLFRTEKALHGIDRNS